MKRARINGLTWYQWARQLFEFENCDVCHKGVRNHTPAIVLGNWVARCKTPPVQAPLTVLQEQAPFSDKGLDMGLGTCDLRLWVMARRG